MKKAMEAKKLLLTRYGDWIYSAVLVLGDAGYRIEASIKRGGRSYVPIEIEGIPVIAR